jgi:DNA-binding IscR family transcriptional regulator
MNPAAADAGAINAYIFGDQLLHTRFSLAIELLARLVIANSRPLTTAALSELAGQSERSVRAVLCGLKKSGLVSQDEKEKDSWHCTDVLETITLADIFLSVSAAGMESAAMRRRREQETGRGNPHARQNVELLLGQATMAINQTVLQHLQGFDLGRLRAVGGRRTAGGFTLGSPGYIAEPC